MTALRWGMARGAPPLARTGPGVVGAPASRWSFLVTSLWLACCAGPVASPTTAPPERAGAFVRPAPGVDAAGLLRSLSGDLAVSVVGGAASIWSLRRRRHVADVGVPVGAPVEAIFSPDDGLLALAVAGEVEPRRRPEVVVVDTTTGRIRARLTTDRLRRRTRARTVSRAGERYFVRPRVVFSRSGASAIVGPFGARAGCAFPFHIVESATWTERDVICPAGPDEAMAVSDDGRLVVAGRAHRLFLFELERSRHPRRLAGVESVVALRLSPDGEWLAAETWEGFRLVRVATGAIRDDCDLAPRSARSSPEARQLVATPEDVGRDLRLSMRFSDDGGALLVAGDRLCLYRLEGEAARLERLTPAFPVRSLRVSRDGREVAMVERFVEGYLLEVLDLDTGRSRFSRPVPFLAPGAPSRDARGWTLCGLACATGLERRCVPLDEAPLEAAGCALRCRAGEASPPTRRCVAPVDSTVLPALERARQRPSPIVARRAAEHLRRLGRRQR